MEILRQEIIEVNSEDDVATLLNDETDDDEFSLDMENEEKHGDPFQLYSNSEDEERSFVVEKNGEIIWTTSTLRKTNSKTPQRNIVTHLPGAKGETRISQTSLSFFELFMNNDIILIIVAHTTKEEDKLRTRVQNAVQKPH